MARAAASLTLFSCGQTRLSCKDWVMSITHARMAGSTSRNVSIYRLVQSPWCYLCIQKATHYLHVHGETRQILGMPVASPLRLVRRESLGTSVESVGFPLSPVGFHLCVNVSVHSCSPTRATIRADESRGPTQQGSPRRSL